jgi:ATP-dependent DNA ligase
MTLPLNPPLSPMLCKAADSLPIGDDWLFEPKWDGFRCIVFRDGESVELTSRNERPFTRYFPEVVSALRDQLPERCVVDGEIILPNADGLGLDFDALLQRIHPAESRVKRLAAETPAAFVAFDLLALDDRNLLDVALRERRALLNDLLARVTHPVYLGPTTTDRTVAEDWFTRFEGAGLDGIIAKGLDGVYTPDVRSLVKVKHQRTTECVVGGYRVHKDGQGVGSFLLGLFDDDGKLNHVGVCSAFSVKQRKTFLEELAPLTDNALDGHPWREWAEAEAHTEGTRLPGGQSRWNAKKDLSWVAVRPDRVVEIAFSQLQGARLRHGAHFVRWRPDREPSSCRYDQLEVAAPVPLDELFA